VASASATEVVELVPSALLLLALPGVVLVLLR